VTKTRAIAIWLFSLLLLLVAAGQAWQTFLVSEDAGGGSIQVSGFQAFPVIGALIALQVTAVLVSLLVRPTVLRWMSLGITPLMLWSLVDVVQNVTVQVQRTFVMFLAEQTGVLTDPVDSVFLLGSLESGFFYVYVIFAVINTLVLVFIGLKAPKIWMRTNLSAERDLPEDLWSNQS